MISVKMREENLGQREAHPVAHHLALGALAALEQERLALAHQRHRGDVAFHGGARGGGAEKRYGKHAGEYKGCAVRGARWPSMQKGAPPAMKWVRPGAQAGSHWRRAQLSDAGRVEAGPRGAAPRASCDRCRLSPSCEEPVRPTPASDDFDRSEHRGGLCPKHTGPVPTALANRVRICRGGRDPWTGCGGAGVPGREHREAASERARRDVGCVAWAVALATRHRNVGPNRKQPRTAHRAPSLGTILATSASPCSSPATPVS